MKANLARTSVNLRVPKSLGGYSPSRPLKQIQRLVVVIWANIFVVNPNKINKEGSKPRNRKIMDCVFAIEQRNKEVLF